ncbi:putative OmpL-like beta-barrel porin-2 [Panacagrimonas perspica]|uniref:Putative OmpL-like beta-barrel porin-2 n=1 Tax=Panacagrimonas perspica TaxID=381431 RepID=A0A4R7P5A3_9GAMM|nr:outer membrane beta-barrel protein [Panacagrimonas perspica]TDU28917.1 putative OmpL-like beta-barrel porin-2 [Panacagrimonas perspica]
MRFTQVLMSSAVVAAAFIGPQAHAAGPTLSDVLGNSGITLGGSFDASYDWSPNDAVTGRVFDVEKDAFSFHQANLTASKAFDGGVGATVNVLLGDDAQITSGGGDEVDVVQGFLSYTAGNLSLIGGRYVTLAGMEVINSAGNLNASRSALFFLQPLTHEGVRATYKINDLASVSLGLNNAQFATTEFDENNTDTTIEAQLALTPAKNLSIYLTGYSGNEDSSSIDDLTTPGNEADDANLRSDTLDLVVNLNVTDALYLGLNADYFNTEEVGGGSFEVYGVAGYVGLKLSPKFRVALRSEYISADDDAGQGDTYLRENTVTLAYAVTDNLELLAEARADKVSGSLNNEVFAPIDGAPEDDQYTGTLKAILKF